MDSVVRNPHSVLVLQSPGALRMTRSAIESGVLEGLVGQQPSGGSASGLAVTTDDISAQLLCPAQCAGRDELGHGRGSHSGGAELEPWNMLPFAEGSSLPTGCATCLFPIVDPLGSGSRS